MPYDFFYAMNAGAGQNLDWFWQRWFFEGGYPDLAITTVVRPADQPAQITVTNKGGKPVPVDLAGDLRQRHGGENSPQHRRVAKREHRHGARPQRPHHPESDPR
ncbi:MAG: hypothetical protein WKG07_31470 [Hymenobacter sp.]